MPQRVPVLHLPFPDDRHCLDPAVRVIWEACFVVGGVDRLEMIEEQERVEVIEPTSPDAPPEMHPGPLNHRLWSHDLRYSA
jgi:hypothetical protein